MDVRQELSFWSAAFRIIYIKGQIHVGVGSIYWIIESIATKSEYVVNPTTLPPLPEIQWSRAIPNQLDNDVAEISAPISLGEHFVYNIT